MGNHISQQSPQIRTTGKVVFSDGSIHEYDNALTVAELMLDHPQEVVVEFQPNGKRPCALPADKMLETQKLYIMLPMKRGKPAPSLSSEQAQRLLMTANMVLKSSGNILSGATGFVPIIARMCVAREGRVVSMDKKVVEKKEEKQKTELAFCDIMSEDDKPEYLSRQLSGKSWKPNLDTIKEKRVETRIRHWLF